MGVLAVCCWLSIYLGMITALLSSLLICLILAQQVVNTSFLGHWTFPKEASSGKHVIHSPREPPTWPTLIHENRPKPIMQLCIGRRTAVLASVWEGQKSTEREDRLNNGGSRSSAARRLIPRSGRGKTEKESPTLSTCSL